MVLQLIKGHRKVQLAVQLIEYDNLRPYLVGKLVERDVISSNSAFSKEISIDNWYLFSDSWLAEMVAGAGRRRRWKQL